jgi:HAMP domain-containing protein
MLSTLFSFPNPVNEKAARTVALVVMLLAILTLATSSYWLLVVLAYGFIARVLTGPTLSPLGRLASSVIAPHLGAERPVPGPPKRFAQGMGAVISSVAAIAALAFGSDALADVLLAMLITAAGLESIFAYCVGCRIFALLMRAGLVPDAVCAECADIWTRERAAGTGA